MVSPQNHSPYRKELIKLKPTVKYPKCYNTYLYKFGKDKNCNQKCLCKKCRRQFTLQSTKKHPLVYPKWPVGKVVVNVKY
jgi:transposase-like protein